MAAGEGMYRRERGGRRGYRGTPTMLATRNICLSTLDAKLLTTLDAKKRAPDVQRHGFFAHDADAIFFSRRSTPKNNRLTTLVAPQKWHTTLDAKPIPPKSSLPIRLLDFSNLNILRNISLLWDDDVSTLPYRQKKSVLKKSAKIGWLKKVGSKKVGKK